MLMQSEKENSRNVGELYQNYHGLTRQVSQLNDDVSNVNRRMASQTDTLDFVNALATKQQLWVNHADGLINDSEMKQCVHAGPAKRAASEASAEES
jgi:hypothetical protein